MGEKYDDRIIMDDPSVAGDSEADRLRVRKWFTEPLPERLKEYLRKKAEHESTSA